MSEQLVKLKTKVGWLVKSGSDLARFDWTEAEPVREPNVFRGQKNMPGRLFTQTTGDFVTYESLLERDWILIKDFDPDVSAILEQPFELLFGQDDANGSHIPDLLLERLDGGFTVCDVKPGSRLKGRFEWQADETEKLCRKVGWTYEVLTEPDPQYMANVTWLGGYKEGSVLSEAMESQLVEALVDGPQTIAELLSRFDDPLVAKPLLLNLLWAGVVATDLFAPLSDQSRVWLR